MTKTELIQEVAKKVKLPKKNVEAIIGATIDTILEKLNSGEKVIIAGFGTFSVVQRKARKGINPRTGERIEIPATRVPRFTVSKKMRDFINK